ncbi:heavy-metal-associated domain-containing protein [Clostridium oceanicum]|uniref:Heavy-metal-associated domain-containing protein n=1 Tax=Clostridium oceanicum TaxID=1543 RepID=A0ABN1JI41_9CLOT
MKIKKTILIEGMSCMHCVSHVKEALEEIGGTNIDVNLSTKEAKGEFDSDSITDNKIKDTIKDFGYEVERIEEN